ncbi:MAG: DMT family transporter [Clostridium butyricum]|nr:DMT family transporter [Clostridium butyricum]
MILNKRLKAIIYMIIASILFTTLNLFGKLSTEISLYMKAFISNSTAFIIISIVMKKNKVSFIGKKESMKFLLIRGICGALSSFCLFYTLDRLILSDSTLLSKLGPFFATIFGFIILKDKIEKKQLIFLFITFLGALFVIKPNFSIKIFPAFIGVLGAAFAGIAFSMIRKIGNAENNFTIIFYNIFFSIISSIPFIITEKEIFLHTSNIVYMILGGLCISFGQIFLTLAYKNAPACHIAMYDYLGLLISAIYGLFIFGEYPDYLSIIGYLIIILVSLINFLSQKKQAT